MKAAVYEAGIHASQINYTNTHATSTDFSYLPEVIIIKRLFSIKLDQLSISPSKAMTCNLLIVIAAIEAISICLSVKIMLLSNSFGFRRYCIALT